MDSYKESQQQRVDEEQQEEGSHGHESINTDTSDCSNKEHLLDINCPNFSDGELLALRDKASVIPLKKSDGSTCELLKVPESNPENEYDLIPGKYEGGSKVWECSVDLAQYLLLNDSIDKTGMSPPGAVLELGCGHGLPAIVSLSLGYESAIFLDFNDHVLSSSTWPGILLNSPSHSSKIQCLAGDWKNFSNDVSSGYIQAPIQYDLILSAETLYTLDCCQMVYQLLKAHLAPSGVAFVASKKYYFGVGGGTMELQRLIEAGGDNLSSEIVDTAADGKSNVRDIIKVWRVI